MGGYNPLIPFLNSVFNGSLVLPAAVSCGSTRWRRTTAALHWRACRQQPRQTPNASVHAGAAAPQAASRALGLFARQRGATTGRGCRAAASRCCRLPSRRRHTVRLSARRLLSQVRQLGHQFQLQCPVVALIHIRIPNMPKEI